LAFPKRLKIVHKILFYATIKNTISKMKRFQLYITLSVNFQDSYKYQMVQQCEASLLSSTLDCFRDPESKCRVQSFGDAELDLRINAKIRV
jgi:hypothetical protein